MIGYLVGKVIYVEPQRIILQTEMGVGYEIFCSLAVTPNQMIEIFTSHIQRETEQLLFGFREIEEKLLFEKLIEVNGVGPKSAFSLMNHLGAKSILQAIQFNQPSVLQSAPGIGKKGAEQIILSLKDKLQKFVLGLSLPTEKSVIPESKTKNSISHKSVDSKLLKDSLEACLELGFKEQEVLPVLNQLISDTSKWKTEDLVKTILKELR